LVELGIVTPIADDQLSAGDVRRAAMAQNLEDVWIPLDGLAASLARGELSLEFMDAPAYERLSSLGGVTFREVSDASTP
jgi:hypothetical protein